MQLLAELEQNVPGAHKVRLSTTNEELRWFERNFGHSTFYVTDQAHGDYLLSQLRDGVLRKDCAYIVLVLDELKRIIVSIPTTDDRVAIWNDESTYKTDYSGCNPNILKRIITEHVSGDVLEAMCGFHTYIDDSPRIRSVTGMDLSPEALRLHDAFGRILYCCDLEDIVAGKSLDFSAHSFDAISITHGEGYLSNRVVVYEEFKRILKPGGSLLVTGSAFRGHPKLLKEIFNADRVASEMSQAGFIAEKHQIEKTTYCLVKGKK